LPEISRFLGIVIHQSELLANWRRLGRKQSPLRIAPLE
jgi:hypothetical protein